MAMEMRARCRVVALPPMDDAALGGPEIVEQPRAVLHVIARAEQIAHEKEYFASAVRHFAAEFAATPFLLFTCACLLVKVPRLKGVLRSYLVCTHLSRGHKRHPEFKLL